MSTEAITRLDGLFDAVNRLDAKSDCLIQALNESYQLIQRIASINDSISDKDIHIDYINDGITKNYNYFLEIEELMEKSFLLQSNLQLNDIMINKNNLQTLDEEYLSLKSRIRNGGAGASEKERTEAKKFSSSGLTEPSLDYKLSVSNLNLKPIRCQSGKIKKAKSRYKLSKIYSLIPVSSPGGQGSSNNNSGEMFARLEFNERVRTDATVLDKKNKATENASTYNKSVSMDDCSGLSTQNSLFSEINKASMCPRTPQSRICSTSTTNEMKKNIELDRNSLDFTASTNYNDSEVNAASEQKEKCSNIENREIIDMLVEVEEEGVSTSSSSPSSFTKTDFSQADNFEKYLRESRINLQEAFPNIYRTRSQESALHLVSNQFKFHNPADNINLAALQIVEPSLNTPATYDAETPFHEPMTPSKTSSKDILTDFMLKSHDLDDQRNMKKDNFKHKSRLFNIPPQSPLKFGLKMTDEQVSTSKQISTSLSQSFLSLLGNMAKPKKALSTPTRDTNSADSNLAKHREESNIREFSKNGVPISIQNNYSIDRKPREIEGSHSQLIIGHNRTKILNHGSHSVFKRPIVKKFHPNSLEDALSTSFQ